MKQSVQKREDYRKFIRRENIENFFKNKREIVLNFISNQSKNIQLLPLLQQLQQKINLKENIAKMANKLARVRAFKEYESSEYFNIQQFCVKLCKLVLQKIIWQFPSDSKSDIQDRIGCLTIIINLLADQDCPNHLLADTICNFLDISYISVQMEGVNKQIIQVGWIIGNLIGKYIFLRVSQNKIQFILKWIEEIILIKDKDMICLIFRSLNTFLNNCRKFYNLNRFELPEAYKSNLINITIITIEKLLAQTICFESTKNILSFITQIIQSFLVICSEQILQQLINRCITQLGSMYRVIFKQTIKILQKIITFQYYLIQNIELKEIIMYRIDRVIMYISEKYSGKLLIFFFIKQMDLKTDLLRFIAKLIDNGKHNEQYIVEMFMERGLQEKMINLLSSKDQDFLQHCFQIVIIATKNNKNNCIKFINAASEFSQKYPIFQSLKHENQGYL